MTLEEEEEEEVEWSGEGGEGGMRTSRERRASPMLSGGCSGKIVLGNGAVTTSGVGRTLAWLQVKRGDCIDG